MYGKNMIFFIFVLLGTASGKSTIWNKKLMDCAKHSSFDLRETMLQFGRCAGIALRPCYQDDTTGSRSDPVSVLHDPCGFIDSQKVPLYNYRWRITSNQTVWVDILKFSLYFLDFPCSVEYIGIKDSDKENQYCGSRVPWKYYSVSSTVFVTFISNGQLQTRGEFQLFFQEGEHVCHLTRIFQAVLTEQEPISSELKHDETQFLYVIAHRLHQIHVTTSSCWAGTHIAAVYDGPGIKSPQIPLSANITSSAFIMLIVVTNEYSITRLRNCQPYLIMKYKSIYKENNNCMEYAIPTSYCGKIEISIGNNTLGTERCIWKVPSYAKMLLIDDKDALERPETLLDDERCIYGGIYVYSKRNGTELQEVFSKCRKDTHLEPLEFIVEENTETVIGAVVFYPYSKLINQTFAYTTSSYAVGLYSKYNKRITDCNIEKVCESNITLPTESYYHTCHHDVMFHAQYVGHSDMSINITLPKLLAPAPGSPTYRVYFKSSLCYTPPHYCTCVHFKVKNHMNFVSYYVEDANHAENSITRNKQGYEVDINLASSLYINVSACVGKAHKAWWLVTFKANYTLHIIKVEKINSSFQFQLRHNHWHEFSLDSFLSKTQPLMWWFLLHIIQNAPKHGEQTDTAQVCIRCLLCYNIDLSVEILYPGKDESVVYKVINFTAVHTHVSEFRHSGQTCTKGIFCATCNIILTYHGGLPQNQKMGCGCGLSILVRKVSRNRRSTSTTSVKGNHITKLSNR